MPTGCDVPPQAPGDQWKPIRRASCRMIHLEGLGPDRAAREMERAIQDILDQLAATLGFWELEALTVTPITPTDTLVCAVGRRLGPGEERDARRGNGFPSPRFPNAMVK